MAPSASSSSFLVPLAAAGAAASVVLSSSALVLAAADPSSSSSLVRGEIASSSSSPLQKRHRSLLGVHGEGGAESDVSSVPSDVSRQQQADAADFLDDVDALRLLYTSTNGDGWTTKDNWMNPAVDVCDWSGVSCTADKRVEKIELSGNNLSGSAPLSVLIRMPFLSVLKLDGNNLDYSQYSEQEGELFGVEFGAEDAGKDPFESSLMYLDLSHTDVGNTAVSEGQSRGVGDGLGQTVFRTGSDRIVKYPRLSDLYLTGVGLRGRFPVQDLAERAPNLERLVLDLNDLTGELPPSIGSLVKLRYLSARDNEMDGKLPPALGDLRKVRHIILRGNAFTGTIPQDLSEGDSLPFLEHLDLSRQRDPDDPTKHPGLTGKLPAFMTTTNLRQLDLSFNSLSGTVPVDFLRDVNRELFDYAFLGNNKLTGKVPAESLSKLPVDAVFLEDNQISDIDQALCSPSHAGTIGCDAILCKPGTYGPGIGRQEDAERPCEPCAGNQFWGGTKCSAFGEGGGGGPSPTPPPPPVAPSDLSETEILLMFYQETGGPGWSNNDGWREAHEEALRDAESRRLGGGNGNGNGGGRGRGMRRRRAAATSFCEWHGVECAAAGDDVTGEDTVEYLLLSANNLVGKPPPEIFKLRNLKTLALADNGIAFSFDGIGEARSLSSLDLANTGLYDISGIEAVAGTLEELRLDGNRLDSDGQGLPSPVFTLPKLEELSLDSCGLSGPIPPVINQLFNLISLSLSDNSLTGPIPAAIGDLRELSTLRLRNNRLRGNLPDGLTSMTGLNILDLSRQWSPDEGPRGGFTGTLPSFADFATLRKLDLSFNSFDGLIPANFLESISQSDPVGFEFADLSSNRLDGQVPEIVATLHNVFMKDNQITSIHPAVCASVTGTANAAFGCEAILCNPGRYNALGRQTSFDMPCAPCNLQGGAQYYGSIACVASDGTEATTPPPNNNVDNDRWIMELIYSTCKGEYWTEKDGWMDDNVGICEWSGVSCSDDGAMGLNLRSRGLKCAFPKEAFKLSGLATLVLDGNEVEFSFEGIQDAKDLRVLDLTHTGLNSVKGIENSVGLTDVFLTSNGLVGPFPQELLQIATLETLGMAFNALTGPIPAELGLMKKLKFLDVNNNDFQGTIPVSFGQMNQLEVILMQANSLSGSFPQEIGSLPNLLFVDLSQQTDRGGPGLTGPIPSFSVQAELKRLDLSGNDFTGNIPSDFLQATDPEDFEYLDLSDNRVSGTAPAILARLFIDTVYLAGNEISGIDGALCLPDLGGVVADYGCNALLCPPNTYNEEGREMTAETSCRPCASAKFYGTTKCEANEAPTPVPAPEEKPQETVPPTDLTEREILTKFFENCGGPRWTRADNWNGPTSICTWFGVKCSDPNEESVEAILLSTNNVIGTPPAELFQLPKLETLVLDNNKILFDFKGVSYAKVLSTLDLSQTGLFAVDGIRQARALKELHLASNAFVGTFPSELFDLNSLEELSLDFNDLTGLLPAEIGMLPNLKLLSVASNSLKGMLPLSLGALTSLITLRLQDNFLTGTLPDGLGLLKDLAFLDLSNQANEAEGASGFTGPLPTLEKLEKIRRLDLSKNSLTGTVPANFLAGASKNFFEYADLSSNHISGAIPAELAQAGLQNIKLEDNLISGIQAYCDAWNDQLKAQFGCDAILCPPDTFSPEGRQETDHEACSPCPGAKYFGTTACDGDYDKELPPSATDMTAESERHILEKLYDATDGYRWNDNKNWKKDGSFCNWKGVKCAPNGAETVTEINLGANNVKGSPPAELFRLPNLRVLSLYSNPLSTFSFSEMERSQSLEELLLDATGIASVDGVGRSKVLKRLNLRFNNLVGSFPKEFTELKTLETLNLAHNRLVGTLPATLQDMENLQTLLLSGNSFQGKLNDAIFPTSIRLLDFSENELSGSIPAFFLAGVPEDMKLDIDLHDNLLTGFVPEALTRFDNMNLLLADNFISGIEKDVCQKRGWNDGDVGKYGCNGLLCPAGQFAPNGRQSSDSTKCIPCPSSKFLGATSCDGIAYTASGGGSRLRVWLPYMTAILAATSITCQFFA